jgi:hypothetical protein
LPGRNSSIWSSSREDVTTILLTDQRLAKMVLKNSDDKHKLKKIYVAILEKIKDQMF